MAAGDPLWSSVVLAMHMDTTGLTDATGKTVTLANGNVSRSGARYAPLTGNAYSALFVSTGRLNLAQNVGFNFGSGNLTVECWVYLENATGTKHIVGHGQYGQYSWALRIEGLIPEMRYASFPDNYLTGGVGPALALNTWTHIAAVRNGNTWTTYTNGVPGTPVTASVTLHTSTAGINIGSTDDNYHFVGNIDALRATKGNARYTAAFTPDATPFLTNLPSEEIVSAVSLPPMSAAAGGGASSAITLPTMSAGAYAGAASTLLLPSLSASIAAHDSTGERALDFTLPALSVAISTGATAKATLPSLSASISGTTTILANADISLSSLSSVSEATVSGMANVAISLPSFSSTSFSGAVCSITIGKLTTQATGTTGAIGRAQVTLPLFEAMATATAENYGSAHITLPSLAMGSASRAALTLPSLELLAIGTATITATYEAYAVNLNHKPRGNTEPVDETTRYTNFPFTHVVRYQNSYYGANATGLYLLEGTTDDATPIPWAVKTAMTDFDSPTHKTVASAYFGGRLGPADTITLHAGDGAQTQAYSYTTPRGALAQNYRQVFGKGIRKHRYYSLAASGSGEFELDDIELDVNNLSRRI